MESLDNPVDDASEELVRKGQIRSPFASFLKQVEFRILDINKNPSDYCPIYVNIQLEAKKELNKAIINPTNSNILALKDIKECPYDHRCTGKFNENCTAYNSSSSQPL